MKWITISVLEEVEGDYKEILEGAVNYGIERKTTSFTRVKAGVYGRRGAA